LLSGRGFDDVYNLAGGISAWTGVRIAGPPEVGMNLITGGESPPEMLVIAYAMEEGLRLFCQRMEARVAGPEVKELFRWLAAMDFQHKERIYELDKKNQGGAGTVEELERRILPEIMEGGMSTEEFLAANESSLESVEDVIILAMMLEAQALDLYLRYADRCEDPETRNLLHQLANEEKTHLAMLGNLQGNDG
jgi:rubrerythrin